MKMIKKKKKKKYFACLKHVPKEFNPILPTPKFIIIKKGYLNYFPSHNKNMFNLTIFLLEIFFKINSKKNKKFVPNNFRMGSSKT
jgi:hypothetical protein